MLTQKLSEQPLLRGETAVIGATIEAIEATAFGKPASEYLYFCICKESKLSIKLSGENLACHSIWHSTVS